MADRLPDSPEQVVFSGGGLRCFWQGGFVETLTGSRPLDPARITGVSGGALSAACFIAGRERALLDRMCEQFEKQDRNIDLFERTHGSVSPHQQIYCEVVGSVLDQEAERAVAEGPQLQILIAHPPLKGAPTLSGVAMTAAYEAELHTVGSPHFDWAEKMGLDYSLVDANAAAREGKLVDLVCAAAVIPPVFEPPYWDGRPVVDGGMADQAPLPDPNEGPTLILLTRRYESLPEVPERHYVAPTEETPADKIDFTDPEKLRRTWEQGEQDAQQYLAEARAAG